MLCLCFVLIGASFASAATKAELDGLYNQKDFSTCMKSAMDAREKVYMNTFNNVAKKRAAFDAKVKAARPKLKADLKAAFNKPTLDASVEARKLAWAKYRNETRKENRQLNNAIEARKTALSGAQTTFKAAVVKCASDKGITATFEDLMGIVGDSTDAEVVSGTADSAINSGSDGGGVADADSGSG